MNRDIEVLKAAGYDPEHISWCCKGCGKAVPALSTPTVEAELIVTDRNGGSVIKWSDYLCESCAAAVLDFLKTLSGEGK